MSGFGETLLSAMLFAALATGLPCAAQTQGSATEQGKTLEQLRQDYATNFLDPAPHMALAKYFRDHGNRLEAFYVLETARRTRFEQEEFNAAFKRYFLGEEPFDNSQEAEAKLLAGLARARFARHARQAGRHLHLPQRLAEGEAVPRQAHRAPPRSLQGHGRSGRSLQPRGERGGGEEDSGRVGGQAS